MEGNAEANRRIARKEGGYVLLKRAYCRPKGGAPGFKVAIMGASRGIAQQGSFLLKINPLVRGFLGQPQLENLLTVIDLVIIPADMPGNPGVKRDDLLNINAGIVRTLCEGFANLQQLALTQLVNLNSNPVNSTVAIAAEVFQKAGSYDPKRLMGVTILDVVRANTCCKI